MADLHLSMTPARPKQLSGFVSGQPSVARKPLGWQNNTYNSAMKALGCVVVDGCPQVLQVTPCSAITTSNPHILSTGLTGNVGEHLATPKIIEAFQAFIELYLIDLPAPGVVVVDRQDVSNVDYLDVPFLSGGLCFAAM